MSDQRKRCSSLQRTHDGKTVSQLIADGVYVNRRDHIGLKALHGGEDIRALRSAHQVTN